MHTFSEGGGLLPPLGAQMNRGQVNAHIGVEVRRPLNFVHQLRRNGVDRDLTGRARVLGHHA